VSQPAPTWWGDIERMLAGEVYRFPGGVAAGTRPGPTYPLRTSTTEEAPTDSERLARIERKVDQLLEEQQRRRVLDEYGRLTAAWRGPR
jgi:hypothetical protein